MPRFIAVSLFLAAAFGGLIAWATYWVLCFGESGGSSMCPDGEATTTMTMQLVVALLGVGVAAAMVGLAWRSKGRAARGAALAALAMFALWAVLNDASVHGWDRDMIFW
jgi:hypothetical protein